MAFGRTVSLKKRTSFVFPPKKMPRLLQYWQTNNTIGSLSWETASVKTLNGKAGLGRHEVADFERWFPPPKFFHWRPIPGLISLERRMDFTLRERGGGGGGGGSNFHRRSGVVVVCWHLQNPFKRGRVSLHLTPVWKRWLIFFLSLFPSAGSGAYLVFPLKYSPLRPFLKKGKIHLFFFDIFFLRRNANVFFSSSPPPSLSRKKVESEKKVFFLRRALEWGAGAKCEFEIYCQSNCFLNAPLSEPDMGREEKKKKKSREIEVLAG